MGNQNPQSQTTDQKQSGRINQKAPQKSADRSSNQPDRKADTDAQVPSTISGEGGRLQNSSGQHSTPGQSSQPKNTREFQASETNFGEAAQSRNLDVKQDEDDLSQPRQQQ